MQTRSIYLFSLALILTALFTMAAKPHKGAKGNGGGEPVGGVKNATILIVRHAEKPESGNGLTPEGEKRALAYVDYFQNYQCDGKTVKPTHLYAAADSHTSHRPRLTLDPLAKALGIRINAKFKDTDIEKLVREIQSKRHGDVVLVAWHHTEIPNLLRALDADPSSLLPGGRWPNHQYNWVIELRYDADAKLVSSRCVEENLK